jgi:hypothetical protein
MSGFDDRHPARSAAVNLYEHRIGHGEYRDQQSGGATSSGGFRDRNA